jgi:hypothetical protein
VVFPDRDEWEGDTPVEANTLAAQHSLREIVDLAAEAEALSGPTDGEREVTPTMQIVDPCRECRIKPLLRIAAFVPPPITDTEAWASYSRCVATYENRWGFCRETGMLWLNWERRIARDRSRDPAGARPWDGTERRRSK